MINRRYIPLIIIIVFVFMLNLFSGEAGKNGFSLLKMEVDARAAAMGGAYTAVSDDASASYWNPAGLADAENRSFVIMHHAWIADFSHDFAAAHLLRGKHNMALSVNLMRIGGIEIRGDIPTEEPYGATEAINFSGAISYAAHIYGSYAVGMNLKYLYEKFYLENASGWAIDLGFRKKNLISGIDIGAAVQNIGQVSKLKQERTPLPVIASGGVGYSVPFEIAGSIPLLAVDIRYIKDEGVYYHFGSEVDIYRYITARIGWIAGGNQNLPAFGISLNYSVFHFDYSYSAARYELDGRQRISLGFLF